MTFINRTYSEHKQRLMNLLKTHFPTMFVNINETSPETGFIELLAYTLDILSFNQDIVFSESQLKFAQEIENIYSIIQNNYGVKPSLVTPAHCNISVSQLLPAKNNQPDWNYALNINNLIISSENNPAVQFSVINGVDFNVDDNRSIEIFSEDDNTNDVLFYRVTKNVKAISGYIKETQFQITSPEKYKTITINDNNIIDIVSITDSSGNDWFEVPTLAIDTVLTNVPNTSFTYDSEQSMPYLLKYKKVNRRFEVNRKDSETIEIIFGSGRNITQNFAVNDYNILGQTNEITVHDTDFLSNSVFGIMPENTILTVKYRVANGVTDNVGTNELNQISYLTFDETFNNNTDIRLLNTIKQSITAINTNVATGGDIIDDTTIMKSHAIKKYASNDRLVTADDYENLVLSMPPKFGRIVKSFVKKQDNNALGIDLYTLCYDNNKNFITPNINIKQNLKNWLANRRILTDGITIKNAFIINIALYLEITTLPNYNPQSVLYDCLYRLKTLLNNNNMYINTPINISNLKVEIDKIDGVQTVVNLNFTNRVGGDYSNVKYNIFNATSNNILYPAKTPSIFEVKYPNIDITGKVV